MLNYLRGKGEYANVWSEFKSAIKSELLEEKINVRDSDIKVNGSPSVTQLCDAYNIRYWKNEVNDKKLAVTGNETNGYNYSYAVVGSESYGSASLDNSDDVIFPYKGREKECYGYWITDKYATYDGLIYIRGDGRLMNANTTKIEVAIRPTISLPSSLFETN